MTKTQIFVSLIAICSAPALFAQSNGTSAVTLPLSGRNGNSGSVTPSETAIPGTTSSVNALDTNISVQGPYTGSRGGGPAFSGKLSLHDAIQRALASNLGGVGMTTAVRQARGQARVSRSALMPNLNGALREAVQQTNLRAEGLRINLPVQRLHLPTIVGPFNYFDLRATLTQSVADMTAIGNYKAAEEIVKANEQSMQDARDLIVLATVVLTCKPSPPVRVSNPPKPNSKPQRHCSNKHRSVIKAALVAQIDVSTSLVQQQTQKQRIATLENDFAKQKINLARIVGITPNEHYELTDNIAFSPAPPATVDEALNKAFAMRSDLKAAEAQLHAAEAARTAARAERLPSLALSADYGAIGVNPSQSHGTFTVVGLCASPSGRAAAPKVTFNNPMPSSFSAAQS